MFYSRVGFKLNSEFLQLNNKYISTARAEVLRDHFSNRTQEDEIFQSRASDYANWPRRSEFYSGKIISERNT